MGIERKALFCPHNPHGMIPNRFWDSVPRDTLLTTPACYHSRRADFVRIVYCMANERKTENLVRKLLADNGYKNNDNVIIEEQQSDSPKIDKLLQLASKSGKGRGYPEFVITFKDNPDNIIVIECKADTAKHQSEDLRKYKSFAVDGALLYASYLKDSYNVMAIAVSGETEKEMKISHFLWLKV
ncbi:MAG: hypothetical protein H6867_09120 [Rhodospirillales bacterium]|nr:hypothetical protein [Rhodospirillales bacterium]MCB9996034.1 hypothetical protein [Rhodospirillales bacterium]